LIIDPNFFLQHFKNKIIFNMVKVVEIILFHPSLLLLFLIWDPGWVKISVNSVKSEAVPVRNVADRPDTNIQTGRKVFGSAGGSRAARGRHPQVAIQGRQTDLAGRKTF
jgi:hypothetical protein